ncbi:hypothetical protein TCAL_14558 [Tigriopus californicus]|uniref:Fibronectin type-III domain-containing protein n=1 Tax=Tigriopus californicus TaxID=6832 RepID=A0A553PCW0_TIGCA|nr:hypothetical protein TCAL_14558 [Tigriopus californicus]
MVPYNPRVISTACLLLLLLVCSCHAQRPSCLQNLRVTGSSPTAISLGWDYNCGEGALFKVYYEHMEWKACPTGIQDETRGRGVNNLETREASVHLEGLHPFSVYKLTVKALSLDQNLRPEELTMAGETHSDMPNVAPEVSTITTRAGVTNLKFYWQDPSPSKCKDFNSVLDGVFYILKGTDRWNLKQEYSGSTDDNSFTFENLMPYSYYSLFLYARNTEGKYNTKIHYKMVGRTEPGKPLPPRDLQELADPEDGTVRLLQWLPPFPPRGEVNYYTLRWRQTNASLWLEHENVNPDQDQCPGTTTLESRGEYDVPVCFTVTKLEPSANYTFQVSATNNGVPDRSSWSHEVIVSPVNEEGWSMFSGSQRIILVIIIAVCLILLIIAISFLIYRQKAKARYKSVPDYEAKGLNHNGASPMAFSNSTLRNSHIRASLTPKSHADTMKRYQHHLLPSDSSLSRPKSIQETPLPPVPKDDHLYEELTLKPAPSHEANGRDTKDTKDAKDGRSRPDSLQLSREPSADASVSGSLDEDEYLPPKRRCSTDTLDMDDYLKPTFSQFQRIDARDMSPPSGAPPPIPMESYASTSQRT